MLRDYALFAIIGVICLMFMPPLLEPIFGGILGTYTTYGVTGLVLAFALWVNKKLNPKAK